MGSYWYMFVTTNCPACGSLVNFKYRVYNKPKPKLINDRRIISWNWCGCYDGKH